MQSPFLQLHETSWITLSGVSSPSVVLGLYPSSNIVHPHFLGSRMSIVLCNDVTYCLNWWNALGQCCLNDPDVVGIFSAFTFSRLYRCTLVSANVSNLQNFFIYPQHTIFSRSRSTFSERSFLKSMRASKTSSSNFSFRKSLPHVSLLIPLNFPTVSQPLMQWNAMRAVDRLSPRIYWSAFTSVVSPLFVPLIFLHWNSLKKVISRQMISVSVA